MSMSSANRAMAMNENAANNVSRIKQTFSMISELIGLIA